MRRPAKPERPHREFKSPASDELAGLFSCALFGSADWRHFPRVAWTARRLAARVQPKPPAVNLDGKQGERVRMPSFKRIVTSCK
jgi:hypothetical protein